MLDPWTAGRKALTTVITRHRAPPVTEPTRWQWRERIFARRREPLGPGRRGHADFEQFVGTRAVRRLYPLLTRRQLLTQLRLNLRIRTTRFAVANRRDSRPSAVQQHRWPRESRADGGKAR